MWGGEAKEGSRSAHNARPDQVVQASQGKVGEEAGETFWERETHRVRFVTHICERRSQPSARSGRRTHRGGEKNTRVIMQPNTSKLLPTLAPACEP